MGGGGDVMIRRARRSEACCVHFLTSGFESNVLRRGYQSCEREPLQNFHAEKRTCVAVIPIAPFIHMYHGIRKMNEGCIDSSLTLKGGGLELETSQGNEGGGEEESRRHSSRR